MNFIKHRSLKCLWFSLLSVSLFLACNRQPESCVSVSTTRVNIGDKVTISDCSERSFNNQLQTGDGASFADVSSKEWRYYKPGTFNAGVIAYSKKGDKRDISKTQVIVSAPELNEIEGTWQLVKSEQREQLFVDPNDDLFKTKLIKTDTMNEVYKITSDSIFVSHNISTSLLFLNQYKMDYNPSLGSISLDSLSFDLIRLSANEMVWKGYYFKGYSLNYLVRK